MFTNTTTWSFYPISCVWPWREVHSKGHLRRTIGQWRGHAHERWSNRHLHWKRHEVIRISKWSWFSNFCQRILHWRLTAVRKNDLGSKKILFLKTICLISEIQGVSHSFWVQNLTPVILTSLCGWAIIPLWIGKNTSQTLIGFVTLALNLIRLSLNKYAL